MLYLLLCILFSTALIILFKLFHQYGVPVAQAIFVNYVVCMLLGAFILPNSVPVLLEQGLQAPWLWTAAAVGALFFFTFYLLAHSARAAGVTITTVAQRVSLVMPATASLLLWPGSGQGLTALKLAGVLLAVVAVVLASWRKKADTTPAAAAAGEHKKPRFAAWILPLVVFTNAGVTDTIINYSNYRYLTPELQPAFTMATFTTAALLGLLAQLYDVLVKRHRVRWRSLAGGLALGVPNLLALIFLLKALSAFDNQGAFVYPINNIGVILLSAAAGALFFHERLRKLNWLGFVLAVAALVVLLLEELPSLL